MYSYSLSHSQQLTVQGKIALRAGRANVRLCFWCHPPQERSTAIQPMTDLKSLRHTKSLLETLPGISDAGFVRSETSGVDVGVVHCAALPLHLKS